MLSKANKYARRINFDVFYEHSGNILLKQECIKHVKKMHSNIPVIEQNAYIFSSFMVMEKKHIAEDDILVGNLYSLDTSNTAPIDIVEEVKDLAAIIDTGKYISGANMHLFERNPGKHVIPAYEVLLQKGLEERLAEIVSYGRNQGNIERQKSFYRAAYIALKGRIDSIKQYKKTADNLYKKTFKKNVADISRACQEVLTTGPKTFLSAVQMVFFIHEGIVKEQGCGSISFGRIDQYLYPFYKRDINNGIITKRDAQKIINALWMKIAQLPKSWQNVTLGGMDRYGNDQSNELTLMCLQASLDIHCDQPQISLRVHNRLAQNVWDKAFDLIQTGIGFPELYNDAIAIQAKKNVGVCEEDAWNYSIVGCVEIFVGGKEYSHTEGTRINWAKFLEVLLNKGSCILGGGKWPLKQDAELDEFNTFSEFYDYFKAAFARWIKDMCELTDVVSYVYPNNWPVPYLSSVMEGCLEKGKDVTDEGTIYNNLTIDCVGIATVANSLEAIEKVIYVNKIATLSDLIQALRNNYIGYEELQKKLLAVAKYGNNIDSVDTKIVDLVSLFNSVIEEYRPKYRHGFFQSGFYSSYFHATMGADTAATPDGRNAGEALSSSLSPMAGTDISGPIAVIKSANKIDMEHFGNGMVLDLRFTPEFMRKKRHKIGIQNLVKEYFDNGGMEIQFNVVDRDTLIDAQKCPAKHLDLIVRVSGFSGYFVDLEKSLQDEIIQRTEQTM